MGWEVPSKGKQCMACSGVWRVRHMSRWDEKKQRPKGKSKGNIQIIFVLYFIIAF